MLLDFERYAAKGNQLVHIVSVDLEVPERKAGRIIRAVFHALRNRLTHEESFHLLAQLPMALKGVYVDGWRFDNVFNHISHLEDFLDEVRHEDGGLAGFDFGDNTNTQIAVASVFKAMCDFISEGEMNDIIAAMPAELKVFIRESVAGNEAIF